MTDNKQNMMFIEAIGWIGAALLILGYYLIQTNKVKHDNTMYMLLNIIGAFLLLLNTMYHHAYPSVVANAVWTIIGLWVAIRIWSGEDKEAIFEI